MSLPPGTHLGPYEILQRIGAGGMGEVYRARHVKLRRQVAVKVLPPEFAADSSRLARFEREARNASALNHPSIVTIHDIAEHDGTTFIAMELVEGRTLRDLIAAGPLPIAAVISFAAQIADGLAKAHAAGIVHRDIKPANVMVTEDARIKILDFGLAKAIDGEGGRGDDPSTPTTATREGMVVGTPQYMSPEQCVGDVVDARSDQFALGVLLHEMAAGTPPFDGPSARAVMGAILTATPPPLRRVRPEAPAELEQIVGRCLEKDPSLRFPSTGDLARRLAGIAGNRERQFRNAFGWRSRGVAAALGAAALVVAVAGGLWMRGAGRRWAGREALGDIARLTESGHLYEAYRTALRAEAYRPADPALEQVIDRMTLPVQVNTTPPGAEVDIKGYATADEPWLAVGVTPLKLRVPYALMHWRITRSGYEAFDGAPFAGEAFGALAHLTLEPVGSTPSGMVRIPGGVLGAQAIPDVELPGDSAMPMAGYYLDRLETSNREFQAFIDAGGYRTRRWWSNPVARDGHDLPWERAMPLFVDATGRPGPATWTVGHYPTGEADYPVGGISWYEAAAYCAFVGKRLPTVYHWFAAVGQDQLSDILMYSNMDGNRKAPVGRFRGLGGYGTLDMAGNVKEWAWNSTGHDRFVLGGAWNEPRYLFKFPVAEDPLARDSTNGVRCARYDLDPTSSQLGPVVRRPPVRSSKPLDDAAFALVRGMYRYDRIPLDPRLEGTVDSLPGYRKETVSIRLPYGSGRMRVLLFFPREVPPPYQSVIWFPGGDVFAWRSSATLATTYLFDFLPRGGRVLVYPIYKGMYERFEPPPATPSAIRDRLIRWSQEVSRTFDYLESRPDFDARKVAYYGLSMGAVLGPVFTALEPRFGATILLGGGIDTKRYRPESDPAVFAPRSRSPTLMINGRDDFIYPYRTSELPLFALLGAPPTGKRLARLEGGHIPSDRLGIIREILGWLDRYLGPVAPAMTANRIVR